MWRSNRKSCHTALIHCPDCPGQLTGHRTQEVTLVVYLSEERPQTRRPHVKVSLDKILNPKMPVIHSSVCKYQPSDTYLSFPIIFLQKARLTYSEPRATYWAAGHTEPNIRGGSRSRDRAGHLLESVGRWWFSLCLLQSPCQIYLGKILFI